LQLKRLIVEARNLLISAQNWLLRQSHQMAGFDVFLINLSGMTITFQRWFFNVIMVIEGLFTKYVVYTLVVNPGKNL
jgi:hypothetical protein